MRIFHVLLAFSLLLLVSTHGEANTNTNTKTRVHIVYMGASSRSKTNVQHAQLLSELMQSKENSLVQTYSKSFLGFAARLSKEEAKSISGRPGVLSVFPDSVLQLHTTHSWDFLRSQVAFKNIGPTPTNVSTRSSGRDSIIGFIDTGIWPQHPSFNDTHMGPIPQRWRGTCMVGENSSSFKCNRKVIGARYCDEPDEPGSITTAMDENGHGTHVASTAAGTPVYGASYYSLAKGVARGGSTTSRIAAYRVCGDLGCADSSVLKAFDDAISDGVDVISISLGGNTKSFLTDAAAIGAFHATEKGIIVVTSAGNNGPSPGTILSVSPWVLTVAATTMDRDFQVGIVLGDGNVIKGGGINFPILDKSAVYHLVDGRSVGYDQHNSTNATNCIPGSLDDAKVKGKIVLCENNDDMSIYDKIDSMTEQGVIGIILIDNYFRQATFRLDITTPFAAVNEAEGTKIQSYINSTRNPMATILPTQVILDYKPAPVVAIFSSRGPAPGIMNLLKPDVAAPGVGILAAWRFNDTDAAYYPGKEPPLFTLLSGTSMACPHVSGVAATVKSWHPTWTPSAIRSAIMTTAISTDNVNAKITTINGSRATPYDIGAGEINLFEPSFPGLIYETETIDYVLFLCNLGYNTSMIKVVSSTVADNFSCPSNSSPDSISDMNYPSIVVSGLTPNVKKTVRRTVTNVGEVCSTYTGTVEVPAGVHVEVFPNKLHFTKTVKKLSFQVTFTLTTTSSQDDMFGSLTWANNFHQVRSPFVVSNA